LFNLNWMVLHECETVNAHIRYLSGAVASRYGINGPSLKFPPIQIVKLSFILDHAVNLGNGSADLAEPVLYNT